MSTTTQIAATETATTTFSRDTAVRYAKLGYKWAYKCDFDKWVRNYALASGRAGEVAAVRAEVLALAGLS